MHGANGDTAKPAPRYADDHYENPQRVETRRNYTYALYTMREYSEFAPYGRYRKDGRVIRVETDGMGGLVEYAESSETHCFGVERKRLYVEERPDHPPQDHSKRVERRNKRLRRIVRWIRSHPDVTKWDVAERFGVSTATAWHDLNLLKQQGELTDTRHVTPTGGSANYTWAVA